MKLNKMFLTFSAILSVNLVVADIRENNLRDKQEIVYSSIAVDMEKNRIFPQQVFSTKNGIILASIGNEFYRKDNSEKWQKIGSIKLNQDEKIIDIIYDNSAGSNLSLVLTDKGQLFGSNQDLNNLTLIRSGIKKVALIDDHIILLRDNMLLSWNTYSIKGDLIELNKRFAVDAIDAYIRGNSVISITSFKLPISGSDSYIGRRHNIKDGSVLGELPLGYFMYDLSASLDFVAYNNDVYALRNYDGLLVKISGNGNFKIIYKFGFPITKGRIDLQVISSENGNLKEKLVIQTDNKHYIYDIEENNMTPINLINTDEIIDSAMDADGSITYITGVKESVKEKKIFEAFNKANYPCFIFNDITHLPISINTKLRCSTDVRLSPSFNLNDTRVYANGVNQFPLTLSYQVKKLSDVQLLPPGHSNLVNTNNLYIKNEFNNTVPLNMVNPFEGAKTSPAYSLMRNDFNLGVYNPSVRSESNSGANFFANTGEKQFYFMVPDSNYINTNQKYSLCTKQPEQDRNFNTCASQVDITAILPLKIHSMGKSFVHEPGSSNIYKPSYSVYEFKPDNGVQLYKVLNKTFGNHSHEFQADWKNPSLLNSGYNSSDTSGWLTRVGNATLTIPSSKVGGSPYVYLGNYGDHNINVSDGITVTLDTTNGYDGSDTSPIKNKSDYLVWVGVSRITPKCFPFICFPNAHMTVDNVRVDLQDMYGNITRDVLLNNGEELRI